MFITTSDNSFCDKEIMCARSLTSGICRTNQVYFIKAIFLPTNSSTIRTTKRPITNSYMPFPHPYDIALYYTI